MGEISIAQDSNKGYHGMKKNEVSPLASVGKNCTCTEWTFLSLSLKQVVYL